MPPSSTKDPTQRRIRAFEQRYGRQATHLAAHAAFPLTLNTDVIYCLRETFLPQCPWYAAGDVLLSGLCTTVGHDLYEMDAATRRYLLRYLRDQFGEAQLYELERFMVAYLRYRLSAEASDRPLMLGEQPHWTTLACLRPGEAYDEIRQWLQQLALRSLEPRERFRWAALVESYGDFLDDFLADKDFQPLLVDLAERLAEGEPIDETAALSTQLVAAGFQASQIAFEVATIHFGAEPSERVPGELQPFEIETVIVNDRGEGVLTETHQGFFFEEWLTAGDGSGASALHPTLKLVAIPSGELMMGSPENEQRRYSDEGPQHRVEVPAFFISQCPITQAQWRQVAALPVVDCELAPDPANFKGDDRPVERVSWREAVEFCKRLSGLTGRPYRLPTEAEWEYACRAETTTPFYFGATITTALANYDGSVYSNEPEGHNRGETTPVAQFPPNAFGLYDLHGNVREWCLDHWHGSYEEAPTDGSAWLTENEEKSRVVRGGSWFSDPRECRSACRYNSVPGSRLNVLGFRVVCEARGL